MPDFACPWCSTEIVDGDYFEQEPEKHYEVSCPRCGRAFDVMYHFAPVFETCVPDELAVCQRCTFWDDDRTCCAFPSAWGEEPLPECPLEYQAEE